MKLYNLRIKAVHPHTYKPNGCDTAVASDIYWDTDHQCIVVELYYDNGAVDWIPFSEIKEGYYEVQNV